jgi:hypothetical protein
LHPYSSAPPEHWINPDSQETGQNPGHVAFPETLGVSELNQDFNGQIEDFHFFLFYTYFFYFKSKLNQDFNGQIEDFHFFLFYKCVFFYFKSYSSPGGIRSHDP